MSDTAHKGNLSLRCGILRSGCFNWVEYKAISSLYKKFNLIFFSFLFLAFCSVTKGQNVHKIDSLRSVIRSSAHDSLKISALNGLAKEYWLFKADSSITILKTAYAMAVKIDNKRLISGTLLFKAYSFGTQEQFDSAIVTYEKSLEVSRKNKFFKNAGQALTGIGNIHNAAGEFSKALPYYMEALKSLEAVKDSVALAQTYNSLGSLFEAQGDYKQSLNYHFKALAIKERKSSKTAIAMSYNNIGIVYSDLKEFKRALEYHQKALALRKETNNLNGMASSYVNIGTVYGKLNNPTEDINYQKNAHALYLQLNDQYGITTSALNLGVAYGQQKQYALSKSYLLTAAENIKHLNYQELELSIDHALYNYYQNTGEYQKAFEYCKQYMDLKDSVFNQEKVKEINRLNTQYQTEKKEQENKLLHTENELSGKTIKQQKIISYFIISGLVLALLLAVFIFRSYRQKRDANIIITKQKEEVEQKKEIIEEKNKEILDSIHYAKRIQRAVITADSYISKYAESNFILYKPKDIVSGDFYWALEHKKNFYLAIADCTGHGVPGAFMSLLNISILNEAIVEKKITSPDLILNEARKDIIKSLNPEGSEKSQDGMDCILCCFNFSERTLNYAAANNSFYIVRNKNLINCMADKMPVGMSPKENEPFTLHTVQLNEGDIVYCLTDGYPDQFGGPQGKKFKYKQLEEVLMQIHLLPMEEQRNILDKKLADWEGNLEQVDDILLIGIKIS